MQWTTKQSQRLNNQRQIEGFKYLTFEQNRASLQALRQGAQRYAINLSLQVK